MWTIISPWVVTGAPDTGKAVVSNVVTGGVAVLLGPATTALGAVQRD